MRRIKLRESDCYVYVIQDGEERIPNEVCFSIDEWAWCQKILVSHTADKETQKEFFLTVLRKKKENSSYEIFMDFPKEIEEKKAKPGLEICLSIIESLKGKSNEPESSKG